MRPSKTFSKIAKLMQPRYCKGRGCAARLLQFANIFHLSKFRNLFGIDSTGTFLIGLQASYNEISGDNSDGISRILADCD